MAFDTSGNQIAALQHFQQSQHYLHEMFQHAAAAGKSASKVGMSFAQDLSSLGKAQLDTISQHSAQAGAAATKVGKNISQDVALRGTLIAGGVAQALAPMAEIGLAAKKPANAIAKGAARTLDPIIPHQKATPYTLGGKQEPDVKQRVAALFKGVTYADPIKANTIRSNGDFAAIKAMSAQVSINGGVPGLYGASPGAFKQFSTIHEQSHHAVIGAFASLDRIIRGEHDAEAAQRSLEHVQALLKPAQSETLPSHVIAQAKIAERILKAEMSGIRDIGNAISARDITKLNCGLAEMSVQMRDVAQLEQVAFEKKRNDNLYSLRMLEYEKPKEPSKGLFSRVMRGFSNAADARYQRDIVAYDERVATANANIKAPPSKATKYSEALAGVSGYYMSLASDISEQLELAELRPSLQERLTQSVQNVAKAFPEMSFTR